MKTPVTHLTRQARHEFEMDAIAACFIGGTAVTGGIGTIPGAMVGALIMGVLNQGLSIMGVDAAWVKTIKGPRRHRRRRLRPALQEKERLS